MQTEIIKNVYSKKLGLSCFTALFNKASILFLPPNSKFHTLMTVTEVTDIANFSSNS